ncbi:KamA family radical SAM protein [Thermosulfuriphilus sp.]
MLGNFITDIRDIEVFTSEVNLDGLERVTNFFPFKATEYYLSLIDFDDPQDPLRRIILPDEEECDSWGRLDPSNESSYTVIPGLQHKYNSTALILFSNLCIGFCRYCFRKRLFLEGKRERVVDIDEAVRYIKDHPEITNAILSGGDPLALPTPRIEEALAKLREIKHLQIIRLGTKCLSYNPTRIIHDRRLLEAISRYSTTEKKIYIMAHFDHAREITKEAERAVHMLLRAGAVILNQTPIIRGVNDSPQALADLFRRLSAIGVAPYYAFQCRPAIGNKPYAVPIEEAYQIFEGARALCSGLDKRARYVMSHALGKIEIVGLTAEKVFFKFHRAADNFDSARFMIYQRNPEAYWFDDYKEAVEEYPLSLASSCYGPE